MVYLRAAERNLAIADGIKEFSYRKARDVGIWGSAIQKHAARVHLAGSCTMRHCADQEDPT
jgi:hypothetical protein